MSIGDISSVLSPDMKIFGICHAAFQADAQGKIVFKSSSQLAVDTYEAPGLFVKMMRHVPYVLTSVRHEMIIRCS